MEAASEHLHHPLSHSVTLELRGPQKPALFMRLMKRRNLTSGRGEEEEMEGDCAGGGEGFSSSLRCLMSFLNWATIEEEVNPQ